MSFQTHMTLYLLWNAKEDILKNDQMFYKTTFDPMDFEWTKKHFQNHTGLQWLKDQ